MAATRETIDRVPELSADHLARLTARYVSIPSVNGENPERDLAIAIADDLGRYGYEPQLIGDESRPSVGVRAPGEAVVLLNGHLDTVPVDDSSDWSVGPFSGLIAGGRVHGRGACDMKGGLAVQVAVAQWLASREGAGGLALHFAMGEERGEPGTESLLRAGFEAPIGVVLEPTDLHLGVAQRGLVTLRVVVTGRGGHASRPELTENPIARVADVLGAIADLDASPSISHPLLGSPTWTPTMVHAGVIPSMVPGACEIHVDRRMIPGETVDEVRSTLYESLARSIPMSSVIVEVAEEEGIYLPAEIDEAGVVVSHMRRALESNGEQVEVFGTPYSSDVRHLINLAGIEAVTFGPGRAQEMHARDEYVEVDQLVRAARVVASFTLSEIEGAGEAGRA